MFTTVDKAIIAVIMGVVSFANLVLGIDFGLDEAMAAKIAAVAAPVLVWLVPNKA